MSQTYTSARFWKCALQVNPEGYSKTYAGQDHGLTGNEYLAALLEACQNAGVEVVGLADHGSVQDVDAIRDYLQPHGIVVFPGFEVASTEKVHWVCLFPEDTSTEQLNRYLGKLDLTDPENGVRPSKLGGEELLHRVEELGGICYAAHSTKDVAKPEDLEDPSASCFVKMTRPTFSSFLTAFKDPQSRVRRHEEIKEKHYSRIERMRITGGYLDSLEINFSDHLNTVIGGRGTGKSTLLECLRYALDRACKGIEARKQGEQIVKENLGRSGGRVELDIVSAANNMRKYRVIRRFGEPPRVQDSDGNESNLHPNDLLPNVEFYGQNEIYELAKDGTSQVRIIERFLSREAKQQTQIAASVSKKSA